MSSSGATGNAGGGDAGGEEEAGDGQNMRIDGADDGIAERRRELLERLNNEQQSKQPGGKKKAAPSQHYWAKWFTIVDKHQAGSTLKFEWWDDNKVNSSGILKFDGTAKSSTSDDQM